MKKFIFLLASVAFLSSCGGGGYESNETLGEIPYIYKEIVTQLNALEDKAREKNKPEIYTEGAKKLEAKKVADVTSAFKKVKGKEVPFTCSSTLYDVKSVKIEEINAETGAMTLVVDFRAKKDHLSRYPKFTYAVVNGDGKARYKMSVNPYAKVFNTSSVPAKVIKAGEPTFEGGTRIMIYPESYDFTDFASIQFVQ